MYKLIQRGADGVAWRCPDGMPPLIHQLLMRRGVASEEAARAFLNPAADQLHDPFLLSGMSETIARLRLALQNHETVCVYGDYDVDGVCATSILTLFFSAMGLHCMHYIPDRHTEGYGLNDAAMKKIAETASLLVTVDCGISCAHEVETAKSLGLDVIVTDHHRHGEQLPDCPVVNPLLNNYPFPSLCGTGVAFKLVCAMEGIDRAMDYIDLAALATVADLVPLVSENRVIVALGLRRINESPRPGIRMLIDRAGLTEGAITAGHIGFQLAPRINASGRLGDAQRAFALLTTGDAAYADELEAENTERRKEEDAIIRACKDMMAHYDLLAHKAIVLCGPGWNSGVIGLAASRLVSEYHYPVILLAETDGQCVGSCRSIPAVDIYAALSSCADLMTRFGGHRQAAGLAMPRENLDAFIARLDDYLKQNTQPDDYIPEQEYDISCPLDRVTEETVRLMEQLQPVGFGNPSPVFLTAALIDTARSVGKTNAHLQVQLMQQDTRLKGICFGAGAQATALAGTTRSLLYAPSLNEWRGHISVQCEVKQFLSEPSPSVFARFTEKYPRYLRAYLTEVLYNIELNSSGLLPRPVSENQLRGWLTQSPQGTLIAAVTREGAQSLLAFLNAYDLTDRVNACAGAWPEDRTAMNCVCLCPRGAADVSYRRVVLWDAPPDAFSSLPCGVLYAAGRRAPDSWMAELPDIDSLRRLYVALRRWGPQPVCRTTLADIEEETARNGGLVNNAGIQAGLAVLASMELVEVDRENARLRLLPNKKCSPENNSLYRRLRLIHDYALEEGVI